MEGPQPGMIGEASAVVTREQSAAHLGSGDLDVLGTPALAALMERAAVAALQGRLGEGESTVGARIDLRHLAPTPVGARIEARARIAEVEGRRIRFQIEARDERQTIGRADHLRVVVDRATFMAAVGG